MISDYRSWPRLLPFLLLPLPSLPALAGDDPKAMVNALDPKSMNQLLEVARTQPDAALTNLMPMANGRFRFLFVWPASNTAMTEERIGQSFAERFLLLARQQKFLALGYCLPALSLTFGTTPYAGVDVNIAYRDIIVRYRFGLKSNCEGRYFSAGELEAALGPIANPRAYGTGFSGTAPRAPDPAQTPEQGLKPFLEPAPVPHGAPLGGN